VTSAVEKPLCDGGILILDATDSKQLIECMKNVCKNLHKFQTYLAYLMDGYELLISPALNVSSNPGFELIIGVGR
jgi:hypothetical protein